ncbi:MAG: DNA-directed RNA polymerase subunit beta [Deltaproteobacteria bacterium]|nr:DNA-directed RNA polymerase subunit beta [Deltaproteobacteria bacterium]
MARVIQDNFRQRKNFAKIGQVIDIPYLIEIQRESFRRFLQIHVPPEERKDIGLQGVFNGVFPIKDYNGLASLEFVNYSLEKPKYDMEECHQRGMTYAAPVKVVVRLAVWEKDEETGARNIRDIKEQEVYFGEIPLMTENGTFIINGTERVVVSQLHRSPGAFFGHDKGSTHASGKLLYSARVIPYRGSWLDFEFDPKDIVHVRIDRRRKMPATVLLRALGYDTEELLDYFYEREKVRILQDGSMVKNAEFDLKYHRHSLEDVVDPKTGEIIVKKGQKFTKLKAKKIQAAGINWLPINEEDLLGGQGKSPKVCARDVVDLNTGEVIIECNEEITKEKLDETRRRGINEFEILFIDNLHVGPHLRNTLLVDKMHSTEEAILEIYRRMRPGEPPTIDTAKSLFENMFFNPDRYDLSKVGRLKLNYKFNHEDIPIENTVLTKEDILETVKYLIGLKDGREGYQIDDIDHLGNRRVRTVGELLENQFRIGLIRMERAIKERMSLQEVETLMPHDLINAKPVSAVVKEFFGSSQLSQFMDQTNPLSEVTHKRRLSALGPGGLTRERAGFEVRDVHTTHYGRICPIETPEGPNIGLIASLSTYARVDEFGFVETPYRKVENSRVTDQVRFYSALEEEKHVIAQANAGLDKKGYFTSELVSVRKGGDFMMVHPEEVTLMDISANQLVSVAASLVPFLENDDANRALMGSNMQRQAVPLLKTSAPLVGTGIERIVSKDSGVTVVAKRDGIVDSVDASRIVVKADRTGDGEVSAEVDIYNLIKYQRSNQNTCINQKPIVRLGDRVKKGDVIADGPATECGELALGKNVLVGFLSWGGYNFEDAILLSERLVREDVFTSVHIEDFECIARDTKLGREEITRDIPNVGEEALMDLDDSGIIRIGAEVKPGDILAGKITPKGETQLSPEEKLLRAIFGEKAGDVRDTSLRVPPGVVGTVIGAKVFSRKGVEKDGRAREIEDEETRRLRKDQDDQIKIIQDTAYDRIKKLLVNRILAAKLVDDRGKLLLQKGKKLAIDILEAIPRKYWSQISLVNGSEIEAEIERIVENVNEQIDLVKMVFAEKIHKLKKGDELPPGVIKMVKVYVAIKRELSIGDKMAGRHGNKGVISRILPEEDMPFLSDGTPLDVVLNPLGVPSRMNVGQILEVHLGWAARELGHAIAELIDSGAGAKAVRKELKRIYGAGTPFAKFLDELEEEDLYRVAEKYRDGIHMSTPVFDGAKEDEIKTYLDLAGLPQSGQTILFDGRTGEPFDSEITVGTMYMLKLHHLVDDKIHARSTGPYSLVTQQPLGGKAQFGGQRLGEMEVWAMEAYGAAHALQEFLTVKSDDVAGRTRMYEAIVKGEFVLEPGLPESFNVLVKELQSLALDVELMEERPK